ncbi:thioredoxin domain-containing protein [Vreelandella aquamarina]|uniref:Thioredoxin domain-containing protein n=1 Tax=Vreelandella aquamarina TaxID=77097 RepID=A0A857GMS9_9GAMM|nr:thioredoxin domain-containing protein [Halomonas meridiana]QHD49816.1 hypothetical protein CTT34_09000 [Halomonas meridiana]
MKKTSTKANKPLKKGIKLRTLMRKAAILLAFLAVPIAWLIANEHKAQEESDLSILGSGQPVAVQVHDHSCPLCQRLKANAEQALNEMEQPPAWRIADINTTSGADFAHRYGVGHVTILLFDGQGNRQQTIEGVTSSRDLRGAFEELMR